VHAIQINPNTCKIETSNSAALVGYSSNAGNVAGDVSSPSYLGYTPVNGGVRATSIFGGRNYPEYRCILKLRLPYPSQDTCILHSAASSKIQKLSVDLFQKVEVRVPSPKKGGVNYLL